jgi:hypothetical protein
MGKVSAFHRNVTICSIYNLKVNGTYVKLDGTPVHFI